MRDAGDEDGGEGIAIGVGVGAEDAGSGDIERSIDGCAVTVTDGDRRGVGGYHR